jgi:hypothetical protein
MGEAERLSATIVPFLGPKSVEGKMVGTPVVKKLNYTLPAPGVEITIAIVPFQSQNIFGGYPQCQTPPHQ